MPETLVRCLQLGLDIRPGRPRRARLRRTSILAPAKIVETAPLNIRTRGPNLNWKATEQLAKV